MTTILFLCVANSARSQMAEGLARRMLGPDVTLCAEEGRPGPARPGAAVALANSRSRLEGRCDLALRDARAVPHGK